jgi:predicted dehydrogenase
MLAIYPIFYKKSTWVLIYFITGYIYLISSLNKEIVMKDILTVAQIGCGAFAEGQDFPNFTRHPNTSLKWCCDLNLDRAQEMAAKFNVPNATDDFMDIVNDPEVDMIKIATTHEAHLPIIQAAAAKGKHIFCEKPMALEEEEAYKIISAVRKGGVKLCVDLNRRMAPSMHALKAKWLEQREDPKHQPWRYIESNREKLPEEKNANLLMTIQDESSSYRLVHLDPLKGGGEIIGETVHWLDLACWFFAPQIPVHIQAWGSARLSHGINLKFSGGDSATIVFHCTGTFDYPKEMYQLASDAALFKNMFFVENRYYGMPDAQSECFPLQHDCMKDEIPEEGFDAYMKKYYTRARKISENARDFQCSMPLNVDKGHYNMLCGFVDAIINDTPAPCDEIAGYMSTYLAKMAIKSIELGTALPIPVERATPVFSC